MVDAKSMCRQHLLGEHSELHKHRHVFKRGYSIAGRVAGNAIEPRAMKPRHDELAKEMRRRGYRHQSPYTQPSLAAYPSAHRDARVDVSKARKLLLDRCAACREQWRRAP